MQLDRVVPRVQPQDVDVPGIGAEQAENDPDRGGLAGAVRAEEAGHLTGLHGQVETVERLHLAEGLVQLLNLSGQQSSLNLFAMSSGIVPA